MSVQVVNSGPGVIKVSVETTPAITVTSPEVSPVEVTAGLQGETGPQGATGPQGPAGADGADGQGVPAGGDQYQVLRKASGTDYDTEWDYADRVTIEVRFDEAVSKGDPLYVTGYNNGQNRITVARADAADSSKMPSIGLAFSDYSQNDNGQVTTIGSLEDIDTQVTYDFQEGDVVYVASGGGLTNVKPTGTNLIQNVGKVGRRQQNNGEIVVMAIGRSNDIPNIQEGYIWAGNSSGVATATDTAYVDIANSRVGIGTTSPTERLHVDGRIKVLFGTENVLVGDAGVNLTGYSNTALGSVALMEATSANQNVAVGQQAQRHGTGNYNTTVGTQANMFTTGHKNVAIGGLSAKGASGSTFSNTVAVGYSALTSLTTGSGNTAVGDQALTAALTGSQNTALGAEALNAMTTGGNNTAVGYKALESVTSGNANTAVGYQALDSLTTANSNTVLGRNAGAALTTGSTNVLIGNSAGATLNSDSNKLYISNSATNDPLIYGEFDGNGFVKIQGDAQIGKIQANAPERALTITGYSAAKLKFNLHGGFGRPEFSADFGGKVKFTNQGASTTLATLQIGESSSREGAIRMFSNGENAIQIGNNAGYSVVAMGIVEGANDYTGGLKIKTRSGTTTTSDFFFSKDGELGVGTASPDEALHVVGQIKVDDGANPYTLPAADGNANEVLQTDGSGAVTFASITQASGNELENVVEDLTPQLGGDLDVNGKKIVSAGNGDIVIDPHGTGAIVFKSDDIQFDGGGAFAGKLKVYESDVLGSNFIALAAPLSVTSDTTLTLPDGAGINGQALKTNGAGSLSWGDFLDGVNDTLTGVTNIKDAGATRGQIAFYDDAGDNYVAIKSTDTMTSDYTLSLPAKTGADGTVLTTDGSGNLSFKDPKLYDETDGSEQYNGDSIELGSGPGGSNLNIEQGKLYYLDSSQQWEEADADAASTSTGMLSIATSDDATNFMIRGIARHTSWSGFTTGDILYVSTTAGEITNTAPSGSGDIVRVIGYCTNGTNREIFFDPDKTWIEL